MSEDNRETQTTTKKPILFFLNLATGLGIIISIFLICGGLFVEENTAKNSLKTQGYTQIHIEEKKWFFVSVRGCGVWDAAKFEVSATNPIGKDVKINVCVTWPFTSATIRTE